MNRSSVLLFFALATFPAWAQKNCPPIETRAPNAAGQQPAFRGQTRACAVKSGVAFQLTVIAKGLSHPWAVEPLPDGALLVSERPGRLRVVSAKGDVGKPIAGLPPVDARGQGGLLDVALSPQFASDRTIFWSYAEPRRGGNGTAVARGVLSPERTELSEVRVIFRAQPTYDGTKHFGSRLAFTPDGRLFVTTGERSDFQTRKYAQDPASDLGKVVRIDPQGAEREVWSLGHRNLQAMAVDAEGRLWTIEHGPRGGDELNLIEKGKNYGWPLVSYGEEYSGQPIAGAVTQKPGFEQPRYYWDPVIAPSGAQFYSGRAFPEWRGNLFIGSLGDRLLVRLVLEDGKVIGEEHLLAERRQRVRDVREGPDGALYLVTDESRGELWKLAPARR